MTSPSETISCPHETVKRFRHVVGEVMVIACNRCDPVTLYHTGPVSLGETSSDDDIPIGEIPSEPDPEFERLLLAEEAEIERATRGERTPAGSAKSERRAIAERALIEGIDKHGEILACMDRATQSLKDLMIATAKDITWARVAELTGRKSPQAAYAYAHSKPTRKATS